MRQYGARFRRVADALSARLTYPVHLFGCDKAAHSPNGTHYRNQVHHRNQVRHVPPRMTAVYRSACLTLDSALNIFSMHQMFVGQAMSSGKPQSSPIVSAAVHRHSVYLGL